MSDSSKAGSTAVLYAPPRDAIPQIRPGDPSVVPIFLGCDEKFLPHSLEVIASFMAHASPDNFYDIFIIESDIPRAKLDTAAAWIQRYANASLRFVDINPWLEHVKNELTITKEYSAAVYFRLFAPGIFAAYDKMAYLDSDIAVLDNIAGFYNQDLEGMPLAAVEDHVSMHQATVDPNVTNFWREQLGKEPGEKSFYSGGLVMDLKQMREMNTEQLFLEKIRVIKNCRLPDQDVMNAVLNGKIKSIPLEWNCLDWMYDPTEAAANFLLLSDESRKMIRETRPNVKVIHYAEKKPWTMAYMGKYAEYYWKYAAETPFYEDVRAAILRENQGTHVISRNLLTYLQQANFKMRSLFCAPEKLAKYQARIGKLVWRRQAMNRQSQFVNQHLKNGK